MEIQGNSAQISGFKTQENLAIVMSKLKDHEMLKPQDLSIKNSTIYVKMGS